MTTTTFVLINTAFGVMIVGVLAVVMAQAARLGSRVELVTAPPRDSVRGHGTAIATHRRAVIRAPQAA
jgi:hypothetical protein